MGADQLLFDGIDNIGIVEIRDMEVLVEVDIGGVLEVPLLQQVGALRGVHLGPLALSHAHPDGVVVELLQQP